MISTMVRTRIETALSARNGGTEFLKRMDRIAASQDAFLDDDDRADLAEFGARYVRGALRMLQSCDTAASQARAGQLVAPVLEAAESFFLRDDPDQTWGDGLFGALCCAYAAREVVARASEIMRNIRGIPLLATDPHPEKEVVEAMIGAETVAILSAMVERAVSTARVRHAIQNGYSLQGSLRASSAVDDWAAPWEVDVARFGEAIGIEFTRRAQ